MSLLDKLTFLKTLLPSIISIMNTIVKCLEVILGSNDVSK